MSALREATMIKHGMARKGKHSREYRSWGTMRTRCSNKNVPEYPRYGGSGIRVCDRWKRFENFLSDMGLRPQNTTLDRINNLGNYEPNNCRWATRKQQSRNTKQNVLIRQDDETHCLLEWSEILGVHINTLYKRIHKGWSVGRILSRSAQ